MNRIKKISCLVFFALIQMAAKAQEVVVISDAGKNNDLMRSNGKIYLVMTIVVVLIAGLLLYVASIDKRISKLENK